MINFYGQIKLLLSHYVGQIYSTKMYSIHCLSRKAEKNRDSGI